jgi:GAF domain-containing protein
MTLGFPDARALSSEDRAFVLALARQCAQALERARLYEGERASRAAAERLAAQLAGAALAIARQASLTGVLHEITVQARAIIGAHQAVTSMTTGLAWEQAIHAVARSEQYAACAGDAAAPEVSPTSAGPAHLVAERNAPMRMTQAELEAHPGGQALGAPARRHPSMRGWLAAPLVASDGANLGLIQLSDKVDGEFTAADESILIQLARWPRRRWRTRGCASAPSSRDRRRRRPTAPRASSSRACRTTCAPRSTPSGATRSWWRWGCTAR